MNINKIINSKKITIISLLVIVAVSLIVYNAGNQDDSSIAQSNINNAENTIISNYNGGTITLQEAQGELNRLALQNDKLKDVKFSSLGSSEKEAIIKEIVLREISYKEAKKQNLHKSAEYKKALNMFEAEILKQNLYTKIAKDASSDEAVNKNYDELVQNIKNKEDFRIRYISLATKDKANSIYKKLIKFPNSFARQAKNHSLDKDAAKKGGDLGFVLEDFLQADILKQAKSLKKGEISKPIALNDKWAIIKLEEKRSAKIGTIEDLRNVIVRNLSTKALKEFITQSITEAKINIIVQ
jgi:foldase protein PrsA